MSSNRHKVFTLWVVAGLIVAFAPAQAADPALRLLSGYHGGLYRVQEDGRRLRALCLPRGTDLVHIAHPGISCGYRVLEETAAAATVNYECPGAGWGRSTVHLRDAGEVQIDTQGTDRDGPFEFTARAVRTGGC